MNQSSKSFLILIIILLLFVFSPALTSCSKGKVEPATKADTTIKLLLTADLDNDKLVDTIIVKPITTKENLSNFITVNPWDTTTVSKYCEPHSLRIKFAKDKKEFLLHDSSYFATPIWTSDSLPISILKKNQSEFAEWKKNIPELNSEAIVLGTEAGIDILLYWNGKEFKLFWPDEEP